MCSGGTTALSGTAEAPITIRAQHQRKAYLKSDGTKSALSVANCSYVVVDGLRASNAEKSDGSQGDGAPMLFTNAKDLVVRNSLLHDPNVCQNIQLINYLYGERALFEDNEFYNYHRHALSVWQSRHVVSRRNYFNSRRKYPLGTCSEIDNHEYGDEAVSFYGASDSIVENNISENFANGFQNHGIGSSTDPLHLGGRHNRIVGSVSLGDKVSFLGGSRLTNYWDAGSPATVTPVQDLRLAHDVAAAGSSNGVFFRQVANAAADHMTLFGSSASGLAADSSGSYICSPSPVCSGTGVACTKNSDCGGTCSALGGDGCCIRNDYGCTVAASNVLAFGNGEYGAYFEGQASSWSIVDSNLADNGGNIWCSSEFVGDCTTGENSDMGLLSDTTGHVQTTTMLAPSGMGLGPGECLLWAPTTSNMFGAGSNGSDLGATILYRYETPIGDAEPVLTTKPLWSAATGAFPCGVSVQDADLDTTPGAEGGSCSDVHVRLNVNQNGCAFPPGFVGW